MFNSIRKTRCFLTILFFCIVLPSCSSSKSTSLDTSEIIISGSVNINTETATTDFVLKLSTSDENLFEGGSTSPVNITGGDSLFVVVGSDQHELQRTSDGEYRTTFNQAVLGRATIELRRINHDSALNTQLYIPGNLNLIEPAQNEMYSIESELQLSWSINSPILPSEDEVPNKQVVAFIRSARCIADNSEVLLDRSFGNRSGEFASPSNPTDTTLQYPLTTLVN